MRSFDAMGYVDATPTSRLGILRRGFARAMQISSSDTGRDTAARTPVMLDFLAELLAMHALLQQSPTCDVASTVHDRLFSFAERHANFREARGSTLMRECRALRQVFVPLVANEPRDAAGLSLAHDIIDACMTFVADSFVHEEELLKQSREQFAEIIDTIPQLVWRTTVDGEATFANRPFLDYVGCTREEVLGWGWISHIHPDDKDGVIAEWARCRAAEMPVKVAFRVRGANGYRWFLSLGNPYRDDHGTMVAYYGTWTDIHDYKTIEQQLKQAIAARDEFLSIASHELKTPLTSLQLQVEMHERALERGDPRATSVERLQRLLSMNAHQVARISRLVEEMLDVARIESGQLTLSKKDFSMGTFVREVLERMHQVIAGAACTLNLRVDTDVAGAWDPCRIEQALGNLVNNACKYAAKGTIQVCVSQEAPDSVTLVVTDDGPGVHPENQARIFERFERAISASECSGLGLGLYIVQQIVHTHGGRITLDSSPGHGCKFTIVLPTRHTDQLRKGPENCT